MLRFGTSGVPLTSRTPTTEDGIRRARELGLDALEMSWVNGIRMGPESAACLLYTSPSPRDGLLSRMPSSA